MFNEDFFNIVNNITMKYPEIFNNLNHYRDKKKIKKMDHKVRVNITLDPSIYHKFRGYCGVNGLSVSRKIEHLIKQELKG